jgi:hypothetical protein
MMQVSKRIPFEDPTWLNGIRGMYILSNVIILGIYFLVYKNIKSKNGMWLFLSYPGPAHGCEIKIEIAC